MPSRPKSFDYYLGAVQENERGCWILPNKPRPDGYVQIQAGDAGARVPRLAHRVFYEALVGPIPIGLELDHLCRSLPCVNPAHLEPVTHQVNILRGTSPSAAHAVKATCRFGHALSPSRGRRICKVCAAEARRRSKARVAARRKANA